MKNILLILLLCPLAMYGQTTFTLTAGVKSFTINNEQFGLNAMAMIPSTDTTKVGFYFASNNGQVIAPALISKFLRSDGTPFVFFQSIKNWCDSFTCTRSL